MLFKKSYPLFSVLLLSIVFNFSLGSMGQSLSSRSFSESSPVSIQGIGAIRIGMTIPEASRTGRVKLTTEETVGRTTCLYYKPVGKPTGVSLMVNKGTIARIDISNPQIATLSGAKIGSSENQIRSIYGSRLQTKRHKYLERGHYLIFVPRDNPDRRNRIWFETDGTKVTNWRVGRLPEVGWAEGCS
jgi:hypothetical protein